MLLLEWGGWAEVVLGSRQRGKKRIWYLRMGEEGEREARKKQMMEERNMAFIKPLLCVGTKISSNPQNGPMRRGPSDPCGERRKGGSDCRPHLFSVAQLVNNGAGL